MNETEAIFHASRIAFMIIDNQVIYLKGSPMSYIEWYQTLQLPLEDFETTVRGYVKDGRMLFYKGDFIEDEQVRDTARKYAPIIKKELGIDKIDVYAGVIKGEVGKPWEPKVKIESE